MFIIPFQLKKKIILKIESMSFYSFGGLMLRFLQHLAELQWTGGLSWTSPQTPQGPGLVVSHRPLLRLGHSQGPLLGLGGSY